jgi:anti-sigma B factor antagonist
MTQHVKIHHLSQYSTLSFEGIKNLDANSAHRVKAEIKGLLSDEVKNVIVDLSNIQFIDSTGFGALISVLKTIKSRDGRMILSGVTDEVRELMDLMQLLSVFELRSSVKDAESQLNP